MTEAKPPPAFPAPASIRADLDGMADALATPIYIPPPLALPTAKPSEPWPAPPSPDARRAWPTRFGLATDRLLNVLLLDGDDTWTISLHAAVAQHRGRRWGCVLCGLLDVLVQHDHCAITLNPTTQETPGAAIKAGLLMALVIAVLTVGARFLFQAIF